MWNIFHIFKYVIGDAEGNPINQPEESLNETESGYRGALPTPNLWRIQSATSIQSNLIFWKKIKRTLLKKLPASTLSQLNFDSSSSSKWFTSLKMSLPSIWTELSAFKFNYNKIPKIQKKNFVEQVTSFNLNIIKFRLMNLLKAICSIKVVATINFLRFDRNLIKSDFLKKELCWRSWWLQLGGN